MYPLSYQYNMDIDWYIIISDMPIHAASNGGHLQHDLYTVDQLQEVQHLIQELPDDYDFELNLSVIRQHVASLYEEDDIDELLSHQNDIIPEGIALPASRYNKEPKWLLLYCWSFIEMARKGFYSFDRDEVTGEYFLVAFPVVKDKEERVKIIESLISMGYNHIPMDLSADCYFKLVNEEKFRQHLPSFDNRHFRYEKKVNDAPYWSMYESVLRARSEYTYNKLHERNET